VFPGRRAQELGEALEEQVGFFGVGGGAAFGDGDFLKARSRPCETPPAGQAKAQVVGIKPGGLFTVSWAMELAIVETAQS
jgi:hypothetical protein